MSDAAVSQNADQEMNGFAEFFETLHPGQGIASLFRSHISLTPLRDEAQKSKQ